MQISTDSGTVAPYRSTIRTNSGPTASNVADAAPPVSETDGTSGRRRDRFGDALLRRIDAGDLRGLRDVGREFRFAGKLVRKTRHDVAHALHDGAKNLVKDVKKELRSVLRELGDDKDTRKAVRNAFKDFRRDVKDLVKDTRSSRQFDPEQIAGDLEAAYNDFTGGLRAALESRSEPQQRSDPADAPSIVPTIVPNESGKLDSVDPADGASIVSNETSVEPGGVSGTAAGPVDASVAQPRVVEHPPASVAETAPESRPRFDGLFGRLDESFKDGVGDIVRRINAALERAHEAFDRFREQGSGGRDHGRHHGRYVDRAA